MEDIRTYGEQDEKMPFLYDEDRDREWEASADDEVPFEIPRD